MSPGQNQVKFGSAQVVKIMYRDHNATDSDSSSDEGTPQAVKKIVKTVVINKPKSASMEPAEGESDSKKKYRGVRKRISGRWCAEIRDKTAKKRLWLGTFDTAEEAAAAYDGAWRRIRGTNAIINFTIKDSKVKEPADNVKCKS